MAEEKQDERELDEEEAFIDEATPEVTEKEKTTPAEPVWSESLLGRAEEYGLSADEAREYETPKALERALALLDRQAAKRGREQIQEAKPAEKKEPETAAEKKRRWLMDKEFFDERLIKTIEEMEDRFDEQAAKLAKLEGLESLKPTVDQIVQSEGQRQAFAFAEEVNGYFDDLEGYEDFIGKTDDLKPDSDELKNRSAIVEEMDALANGYQSMGKKIPSLKALVERAVRGLHGAPKEGAEAVEPSEPPAKRKSQGVAKPTHRQREELKGDALAKRNLGMRLKQYAVTNGDAEDLDGFPE